MTPKPKPACKVPGCDAVLSGTNTTGVCLTHMHVRAYCRCAKCQGLPPVVRKPVLDRPGIRVVSVAVSGNALGEMRHNRISLPLKPFDVPQR